MKFPFPSSLSILLAAFLAGCASIKYEPRPISVAATADELRQRDLANDRLREFLGETAPQLVTLWPRPAWDVDALTLAAFYYHPDFDAARAQLRAARAAITTAAARPNPSLTFTPGYDFTPQEGASHWFPGIDFDFPIETAGKRQIRITRAEAQTEAARLNVVAVAWQLRSQVRGTLADVVASDRRAALLREQANIQQRIVALLQDRREFGAASTQELAAARIAFNKSQMDLADAERQRMGALSHLAEAISVPLAALENTKLDYALDVAPPLPSADARRIALIRRVDINAALADYAASETDLRAEIAKQYPDVHLGPGYQWDEGGNKWSLGIGIELPIFNRNRGPIAEAEARRDESAAKFRALQNKIIAVIDRAIAGRQLADEQLRRAREMQRTLEEQAPRTQARLAAGDIDQLEFQNARLESAVNALALLEVEASAARNAGEVEDALQIPIPAIARVEARANSTPEAK